MTGNMQATVLMPRGHLLFLTMRSFLQKTRLKSLNASRAFIVFDKIEQAEK